MAQACGCLNVWQCRHTRRQIRLLKIHFTNHPFQLPQWEQSFCPAALDNWNPISDKWNSVICCLTGKLLTYALYPSVHWPTIVSNLRLKMRIGLLPSSSVNTTKWLKSPMVGAHSLEKLLPVTSTGQVSLGKQWTWLTVWGHLKTKKGQPPFLVKQIRDSGHLKKA